MRNNKQSTGMVRPPFIGVWNVLRFNYDLFILPVLVIFISLYLSFVLTSTWAHLLALAILLFGLVSITVPLFVSWWVYDHSPLYTFSWLSPLLRRSEGPALNIHAGFDETSVLLRHYYPNFDLQIMDFYDPARHTERSIRRARTMALPVDDTIAVSPFNLGLRDNHYSAAFLLLALHEIRDADERVIFLKQLRSALAPQGRLIVVEHTRDLANFCAYTIGFFHFLAPRSLIQSFSLAGFRLASEGRITPFLRVFVLEGA